VVVGMAVGVGFAVGPGVEVGGRGVGGMGVGPNRLGAGPHAESKIVRRTRKRKSLMQVRWLFQ
jgi:hypothetical protein